MDTRQKIVPAQAVCAAGAVALVIGYFDPLHSAHTHRLRELYNNGVTVVIAIDDPASPLLTRQARAELAASLSTVSFVVTDVPAAMEALPFASVHDLRPEHAEQRESLTGHVLRRQRGA